MTRARLERRLEARPEDRDAHQDYARWLLTHDDEPRGAVLQGSLDALDEPPRERKRRNLARTLTNRFLEERVIPRYPLLAHRFRAWTENRGTGPDGIANWSGTRISWRWGLIRGVGMRGWTRPMLAQGLEFLADPLCRFVEDVDLCGQPITDLRPVGALTSLRRLTLSKTKVQDLWPLTGLHRLWQLYLRGTPVRSLAPLAQLKALEFLCLEATPVTDLAPLLGLRRLWEVWLYRTKVSSSSVRVLEVQMARWPRHDVSNKPLSPTRIVYASK